MPSFINEFSDNQQLAQNWLSSVGVSQSNSNGGLFTVNLDQYNARTGSGLTTQQIQQMQYDSYQKDIDRAREDSVNQRTVADMAAAGINPSLALGGNAIEAGSGSSGGGIAPSSSADVSQNPMSWLGTIQNLMMTGVGMAQGIAQIDKIRADAENVRVDTEGKRISNYVREHTKDVQIASASAFLEGQQLTNKLTSATTDVRIKELDKIDQDIHTSESQEALNKANISVSDAEAALKLCKSITAANEAKYSENFYRLQNSFMSSQVDLNNSIEDLNYQQIDKSRKEMEKIDVEMTKFLKEIGLMDKKGNLLDQEARSAASKAAYQESYNIVATGKMNMSTYWIMNTLGQVLNASASIKN